MAKSKFDMSLLTPIDEQTPKTSGWDSSLLIPIENEESEEEFLPPKQEGFLSKLPRNIVSGLASMGRNIANTPHDIANVALRGVGTVASYAIPGANNEALLKKANPYPEIPNYNYAKMLGQEGSGTKADKIIQKGIEYAPDLYSLAKLSTHLTPKMIKDVLSYGKLKKNATSLESKINSSENKLNEIEQETKQGANQADLLQNETNAKIGGYLNAGATHSVRGASSINHRLGQIENYWSDAYKNLRNELKNSEFKMEDLPKYGNDLEHTIKNIKDLEVINGKLVIKNQPEISAELQSIYEKAPTANDLSASGFLNKYQDFRDARYDLLQRAKTANTSSERKALFKAYEDSKPIEETVSKALNEGLGENKAEFKRINEGYSKQVYPLRNNKVAQKSLAGKLGPNTMADLAGSGEGQELMREIIKQDPELLRNIVGQRYAAKPETLKNIDETTAEYLYEMPELNKIMAEQESIINKQLEKVNQLKNQKEISLKEKIQLESQSKELKDKISRIKKDRDRIWKGTKKAAAYGTALYLGGNVLNKIIGK